jgi:hypothetical protein
MNDGWETCGRWGIVEEFHNSASSPSCLQLNGYLSKQSGQQGLHPHIGVNTFVPVGLYSVVLLVKKASIYTLRNQRNVA